MIAEVVILASLASAKPASQAISFRSGSNTLVGKVYFPPNYRQGQRLPTVIVTGAWFTIQEQMPRTYAQRFAERGMIAVTFDFTGFGGSQGKARNTENPTQKAADIKAAADFIAKQSFVDRNQLVGMAMCASTGYMANAINQGAPLKAMAASALWIQDAAAVDAVYGGKESVAKLVEIGTNAEREFRTSGKVLDVPAAGPEGSDAIMQQAPYYTDPQRGMIKEWDNRFALMSWKHWLGFDSLAPASRLRVPTAVFHSDSAALPDKTREFFAALRGPKAIYWSSDAHMDFYDREPAVSRTVGLAMDFFDLHLGRGKGVEKAHIEDVVTQVANSVDAKAWAGLRGYFADQLTVDYSSLGGRKGQVATDVLLGEWATFHNNYHTMRHRYTNFTTVVTGQTATTDYDGIATLVRKEGSADQRWVVAGRYRTTLAKTSAGWKVTGTTFNLDWQLGQP